MTTIAYLPGDGIGPEVLAAARQAIEEDGFQAEFIEARVGWNEWIQSGDPLPAETLRICQEADAILFGAITSKPATDAEQELRPELQGQGLHYRSPILRLRQELDLFANIRPVLGNGLDLVIFRENTEGLYAGIGGDADEHWGFQEGTQYDARIITPQGAERIVRAAFEYAVAEGRTRVTLLEKANVLRASGGLMLETFRRAASEYTLDTEVLHIDAACAIVVTDPQRFDVVVASNLFGDIFSDLTAALAGGLPQAASASLGGRYALFEPVHGSAPDIAGQGIADPSGAIAAARWMVRWLSQQQAVAASAS